MADLVEGDTGAVINYTCLDLETGAVIDLTGAAVSIHFVNAAGTATTKAMTIISAASGTVKYQFLAGEISAPKLDVEVSITDASGFIITTAEIMPLTARTQLA